MTTTPQNNQISKLLFIVTKSNWGGAQRYVYDLATNLPTDRFEVIVAAGGKQTLLKRLRAKGIRTIEIPKLGRDISVLRDFWGLLFLLQLIKLERPEILHLNSSKVAFLGCLAGRLLSLQKIVFTVHGWPFLERRSHFSKFLFYSVSWITAILAHKIITVSEHDAHHAMSFPLLNKRKVRVIHNGILASELAIRDKARIALQKYTSQPIPLNEFWIGTIGEINRNKNQKILVDAIVTADLPNVHVLIIGDGEQFESLERYIEKHSGAQKFHLLGYVKDAAYLLPALDLFVLPSSKEGFPYVLLEAGLAKLAVVASNVGGIPELLKQKENGMLCNGEDSNELASIIRLLCLNPNLREKLSIALFETVSNEFSLDEMIQKSLSVYKDT